MSSPNLFSKSFTSGQCDFPQHLYPEKSIGQSMSEIRSKGQPDFISFYRCRLRWSFSLKGQEGYFELVSDLALWRS